MNRADAVTYIDVWPKGSSLECYPLRDGRFSIALTNTTRALLHVEQMRALWDVLGDALQELDSL